MHRAAVKLAFLFLLLTAAVFAQESEEQAIKRHQAELNRIHTNRAKREAELRAREKAGISIGITDPEAKSAVVPLSYAEQPADKEILHGPIASYYWHVVNPDGSVTDLQGQSVKLPTPETGDYIIHLQIADVSGHWQQSYAHKLTKNVLFQWDK